MACINFNFLKSDQQSRKARSINSFGKLKAKDEVTTEQKTYSL